MEFIICTHKRSRPKISPSVCEKCTRMKTCRDYKEFVYPSLFPELSNNVTRTWALRKRINIKNETKELTGTQEQLTLNCIPADRSKKDQDI